MNPIEYFQQVQKQAQDAENAKFKEVDALKDRARQASENFKVNRSGMEADQNRAAKERARNDLSQNLTGITAGANRRGLLYSGLRQANELGANAAFGSDLMNQALQIRQNLDQQQTALEDQAVNAGVAARDARQDAEAQRFGQDQATKEAQLRNISEIGSGIGGLVGAYYGNQKEAPASSKPQVTAQQITRTQPITTSYNNVPGSRMA